MPVESRGLWAWGMPGVDTNHSAERSARLSATARKFLVCGLLLLTLPASSSDLNCGRCRTSAQAPAAPASATIPAFVSRGVALGGGLGQKASLCSRGPPTARPISMVHALSRTGSGSGDSVSQSRTRRTDSRAIVDDVNASFQSVVSRAGAAGNKSKRAGASTPVRRRGIGSRTGDEEYSGRLSRAAAKSIAAAKRISLLHEQEFLNQDALLKQATQLLIERADDMTGGSRWGTGTPGTSQDTGRSDFRKPKPQGRYERFTDDEESVTDAMVTGDPDSFYDYSPDLESDWQAQKKSVAKPRGAAGRWKSRLRSMVPESHSTEYSVEEREHVVEVGRQREIVNQELLRKVTMLTKGRGTSVANADEDSQDALFLNPGFIVERRERNERAAKSGGLSSGVGLSELARRGLVGRSMSAQELHRGASAVQMEVDLGGAVFDLKIVGDRMYSAGSDDCVSLYDTKSWEKIGVLEGHTGWVNALAVDTKRNLLYSASDDESVKVWDLATLECVQTLPGHDSGALSLELVDSRLVVGCTGRILVWDTKNWERLEKLSNHTQVLRAMSDGKQLSKNLDIDPRIAIAREASKLSGHKVGGVVSSNRHIFTAVDEGNIWVWDKKHLEVERKLLGPKAVNTETVWVRSLEVLPVVDPKTGKTSLKLLSGWADGALRVFDIATWTLEHTLTAHSGPILSLARVGDKIISTGADMTAAEWDPTTWTLRRVLRNHDGAVCAVGALDDDRVMTVSLDGKLKVWNSDAVSTKLYSTRPDGAGRGSAGVGKTASSARAGSGRVGKKQGGARAGGRVAGKVGSEPVFHG